MSNFLAVATVTATLHELLKASVPPDVGGAEVTMVRPDGAGAGLPAAAGVNIFLYQVMPSAAARNDDLPTRGQDGHVMRRPRLGLDLHYLLTFYGRDGDLEPQRILGSVVRTLHARPVLTGAQITNAQSAFAFLADSNLAMDIDRGKLTQLPLTLEELSKLWSVFFQTPYRLSIAYQATVVLIEAEESFASPLPVRMRNLYVETFREPLIERIVAASGEHEPILAGGQIRVLGRKLLGPTTEVVIGGRPPVAPAPGASDTELVAALPTSLPAGLQGLQVQHLRLMGTPPADHVGVESRVAPFVLTPQIEKVGPDYQITVSGVRTAPDGTRSATIAANVSPPVGPTQRVAMLLNGIGPADGRAYTFTTSPPSAPTDPVEVEVHDVEPGPYLVRVQVDGADSPLHAPAGTYSEPQVTI